MNQRYIFAYLAVVVVSVFGKLRGGRLPQEEVACRDTMPVSACKLWVRHHACRAFPQRMLRFCPKSCNFCGGVCLDSLPVNCRWLASHNACNTHAKRMKKTCPRTCGFCNQTSWQPAWLQKSIGCAVSKHGCCWDGVSYAKGPNAKGCPVCKDKIIPICSRFRHECIKGSRNKKHMDKICPKTCRICKG